MENQIENDNLPNVEASEVADTTTNSDTVATEEKVYTEYEKKLYNELQLAQRKIKKLEEAPKATPATTTASANLSEVDRYNLYKADVHPDDLNEVLEYASWKKISVSEALKSSAIKSTLADKKQERDTIVATSIKGTARGTSKLSDDSLLAMARKGEMPDSKEDIDRLISIRKGQR